jgi:glyoxylase-like metal-dependent hydrolase (beta-lactamase superfamily II)
MQAEGGAYADNLYTLCGDWMKDSASTPARQPIAPGSFTLGQHRLELVRYHGHTADDLVLIDHSSGVVFAGGLVFAERIPTTPHADLPAWLDAVLRKALHPQPARRQQAAAEFAHDLRAPGPDFHRRRAPPLAERDPVAFWQTVAALLGLAVIGLLGVVALA